MILVEQVCWLQTVTTSLQYNVWALNQCDSGYQYKFFFCSFKALQDSLSHLTVSAWTPPTCLDSCFCKLAKAFLHFFSVTGGIVFQTVFHTSLMHILVHMCGCDTILWVMWVSEASWAPYRLFGLGLLVAALESRGEIHCPQVLKKHEEISKVLSYFLVNK